MLSSMKTYLVTGGAGFIGSNFVKYILHLHGREVRVVVMDKLTYAGNLSSLSEEIAQSLIEFVNADICDEQAVEAAIRDYNPDYVVNFAAETHVDRSITGPGVFLQTNIIGTQTLLECLRRAWMTPDGFLPGKRFLQVSTDEVYGSLQRDFDEPQPIEISDEVSRVVARRTDRLVAFGEGFFVETTPLAPRSPYSASKASADFMTLAYHDTYGLPVCITRCSNNYGPRQFPEKLIPLVINNIIEGRPIPVYGKGLNVRDWLYVDDHCKAIDLVLRHGRDGEIYNIGGFNEKANIDIVNEIVATVKEWMPDVPEPKIEYVKDRPGHDMRYAIDPEKIVRELGWYPETPFSTGIRRTVKWYLDNREWMDSVVSGEYRKYYKKMYDGR